MRLRRLVSQLLCWPSLSIVTLFFLLGKAFGEDWDEKLAGAAYPAVEYAAEKPNKAYNIPLELNEEPFVLVEWSTEASRLRRRFQFAFPPGILLVASIAAAALAFAWNTWEGAPFALKKNKPSQEAEDEAAVGPDDLDDLHEPHYSTIVDSSSVLQSVLRELSANLASARNETLEKKNTAVKLLSNYNNPDSISLKVGEVVSFLLEATDKFAAPATSIANALDALQHPLSDSQATFRLGSALEEMQADIQKPLSDSVLKADLETCRTYLGLGKGPASEPTHAQSDDHPEALGGRLSVMGPSDTEETKEEVPREVSIKLSEWLEALLSEQQLLLEAGPVVSNAVKDVKAAYELL
ncbi:hypothetical protein, conserved [Eimeria praecox]|uniref:Transmembrane protein n=1 Tax=Eimeria praecox TaxID=51316 RepID=U6GLY8_9EIME|nr:hypothetical protein, conserved [Eimeria praecox]